MRQAIAFVGSAIIAALLFAAILVFELSPTSNSRVSRDSTVTGEPIPSEAQVRENDVWPKPVDEFLAGNTCRRPT